jgi:hypothetical protein
VYRWTAQDSGKNRKKKDHCHTATSKKSKQAILDSHGYIKSKIALGSVALRGLGSATSGF